MRATNPQQVDHMSELAQQVRALLRDALALSQDRVDGFTPETPLFGALPELDSMAVATLLTEMEDRFDILIDDEDIDGDTFETFGTLTAFLGSKLEG
ncbi:acyl carrier protein [Sphingobium fontiphilum]|uniref:Acyl carrier protein n=1 Tax=Sphingobium fontiphilum TaxID=944425 RepID=A0A7W6GLQ9_9SPHN|nr:phosphopantetheine-binding protein [Sphingobium fontiphilum]MBB3980431.1 acyl carrier protein [Sphingobium fontiphilum]